MESQTTENVATTGTPRASIESSPPSQFLSDGGVLALLALLSAFIPLSTDMYLPALPRMSAALGAPPALVNLTLVLFFVCYSISTLLWGPLSDKYGRKPMLFGGVGLYVLASVGCALSMTVGQLILFRMLQALGGSAAPAISTALVKDLFSGRKRQRGLVLIQSMVMIAPIVAPLIGGLLLKFTSWRGIFIALAAIGALAMLWSLLLRETVVRRYAGTVLQTLGQLGHVLSNPGFFILLLIFSLTTLPLYAYLAASSYIYEREFGLSEQMYGVFFAFNAVSAVIAPFIYLRLSRHLKSQPIITGCFIVIAASGVLISLLGHLQPWILALCIIPATLTMGVIRPPSTHLMLEQQDTATGTASALIICSISITGSLGMLIVSAGWHSLILPLGVIHLAAGVASGFLWLIFHHKPFIRPIPE